MCKDMGIQAPELPDINGLVEKPPPTVLNQLQIAHDNIVALLKEAVQFHYKCVHDNCKGMEDNFKLEGLIQNAL